MNDTTSIFSHQPRGPVRTPHEWLDEFRYRRTTVSSASDLDRERIRQYAEIQEDALLAIIRLIPRPTKRTDEFNKGFDAACKSMQDSVRTLLDGHSSRVKEAETRRMAKAESKPEGT